MRFSLVYEKGVERRKRMFGNENGGGKFSKIFDRGKEWKKEREERSAKKRQRMSRV